MLKKILIACLVVVNLTCISSAFADAEDHWWYHPDQYHGDFEKWYPEHKEEWNGYYTIHREHYTTFCESHRGWTFCE